MYTPVKHYILTQTQIRTQHIVPKFNYLKTDILFQEVPNEISLCFSITGCNLGCKGCHSTELWDASNGQTLDNKTFCDWLNKYDGLISCVLFFGGEWQPNRLIEKLIIAKQQGLKTCLYSGSEQVEPSLYEHLDFLKTGRWKSELGGLNSPTTNQRFKDLNTGQTLNHLFIN